MQHPLADLQARSAAGYHHLTRRLYEAILDRYLRGATVPSLQVWCGVGERTLWRVVAEGIDDLMARPRSLIPFVGLTHLGLDELFWRNRIVCVIVNLKTNALLDILPDRTVDTVVDFLIEVKEIAEEESGLAWRPVITSDMWLDYRQAIQTALNDQATIVADRFHIQAKVSEDLKHALKSLLLSNRDRPRLLAALHRDFVESCRLTEVTLNAARAAGLPDDRLEPCRELVALARTLHQMWDCQSREEAEQYYRRWVWQVTCLGLDPEPFRRIQYLINLWWDEVFAYFDPATFVTEARRATNAAVESVNGRLRQLERRGRRSSRAAFQSDPQQWDEQRHFNRFWASALYSQNAPRGRPAVLSSSLRPLVEPCTCGAAPEVVWVAGPVLYDLPWGDHPVHVTTECGQCQCAECGREWSADIPAFAGMTTALQAFLISQRAQGVSLSRLAQQAGISQRQLRAVLPLPQPCRPAAAPPILGIQLWRWRRQPRWVLTDAATGRLVDILCDSAPETLRGVLHSPWGAHSMTALLADPEWAALLPAHISPAVDLFTATGPVQRALGEVQRRFTATIQVAARRQTEFHRHRRLILRSPDSRRSLDEQRTLAEDHLRLERLFSRSTELRIAHQQRQRYSALLRSRPEVVEHQLSTWIKETETRTQVPTTSDLARALRFGFRDALIEVCRDAPLIHLGVTCNVAGVNLASSRVLLRHLKQQAAYQQPDFVLLRNASLQLFGSA